MKNARHFTIDIVKVEVGLYCLCMRQREDFMYTHRWLQLAGLTGGSPSPASHRLRAAYTADALADSARILVRSCILERT